MFFLNPIVIPDAAEAHCWGSKAPPAGLCPATPLLLPPIPTPAGNSSYLDAAYKHWQDAGGMYGGSVNPYVSWDSLWAPAVVNMLG